MNRESDEQRAVSQTLCGALQKEANCKCLVLSVLIYGCLAAVTWCRCANVTKVVINYDNYPLKRTEHVSPCDEGYIYIPVAFMGMLYLVYLVECYHSPIRIDLLHAESQDNVTTKLSQLRLAQPTIWWKAVSYHYVRRKRQITRYRNGDNYTTTQVYYERANTHAATSFYFYEYCGVKDISKELTMDAKVPITKISLTKGFAFSNMRSATEFEEARSRFFAEQELRDDYMEMREGLDLGYNFNPTTVVGILGNPWFTNSYVYWCFSAFLLSWPLRIIIEYNTQYADYQVTKLFGVNYDTPTSGEPIHASSSQLSAPGSYMLAPSYSEALLMDPSPQQPTTTGGDQQRQTSRTSDDAGSLVDPGDIVPSYSEALLYERAQQVSVDLPPSTLDITRSGDCECYCHRISSRDADDLDVEADAMTSMTSTTLTSCVDFTAEYSTCRRCRTSDVEFPSNSHHQLVDLGDHPRTLVAGCDRRGANLLQQHFRSNSLETSLPQFTSTQDSSRQQGTRLSHLTRDLSAPNFPTHCDLVASAQFLRLNGNSLENILEHEEPSEGAGREAQRTFGGTSSGVKVIAGCGAIPKRKTRTSAVAEDVEEFSGSASCRVIENPMIDEEIPRSVDDEGNLATSRTYFCLKSILKQHRRRYTLVTADELRKLASDRDERDDRTSLTERKARSSRDTRRANVLFSRDNFCWRNRDASSGQQGFADQGARSVTSSRSLIFPSPIEEACRTAPNDPFGGKAVHVMPLRADEKPPDYGEALGLPGFSRLARSLTSVQHKSVATTTDAPHQRVRPARGGSRNGIRHHRRNLSVEPEYLLHSDGWETNEGKPVTELTVETEVHGSLTSEGQAGGGSSSGNCASVQMRRVLTRGQSLNETGRVTGAERNRRKKYFRASLTEDATRGGHPDDPTETNLLGSSKRFNVSMETSL